MARKVAKTAEPAPALAFSECDALLSASLAARENNATTDLTDGSNRTWFVGVENVSNRSHVLIRVHRGDVVRDRYLPTDTFGPEAASAAILELDGALP